MLVRLSHLPATLPLVDLGQRITSERKKRGWTQQQFAERAGVSPRTVGNWERLDPPADKIPDIELALGINLRDEPADPAQAAEPGEHANLSEWIQARMARLDIPSYQGLARHLGVAVETARQLVLGGRIPDGATIKKVATTMGLDEESPTELLSHLRRLAGLHPDDNPPYVPPRVAAQMTSRERRVVDQVIEAFIEARGLAGRNRG